MKTDFGTPLSRKEMKNVKGGRQTGYWTCVAIPQKGYHIESNGSCFGDIVSCNVEAETWCAETAGCAMIACA